MKDNERIDPPTTVKEVGIHLTYLREDMKEIKDILNDTPRRKEFTELEARVGKIEAKRLIRDTLLWVGMIASTLVVIIQVWQKFGGQ